MLLHKDTKVLSCTVRQPFQKSINLYAASGANYLLQHYKIINYLEDGEDWLNLVFANERFPPGAVWGQAHSLTFYERCSCTTLASSAEPSFNTQTSKQLQSQRRRAGDTDLTTIIAYSAI